MQSAGQIDCLNPVAQKLLSKYFPLPNFNSGSTTGDYRTLERLANETNGYDLRFDQYIGSKNLLFGRWTWKNLPQQSTTNSGFGNQPGTAQLLPPTTNNEYDKNLIISDNYTLTSNMVNEFRFGLSRLNIASSFPYQGAQVDSYLGLTGLDLSRAGTAGAFPGFDFSSGTGFTNLGHDSIGPTDSKVTQYSDNLSWIKGKHTLKFGVSLSQVQYDRIDDFGASDEFGSFTFNGMFSNNAFADFLLGLPATNQVFRYGSLSVTTVQAFRHLRARRVAYIQELDAQLRSALGVAAAFLGAEWKYRQLQSRHWRTCHSRYRTEGSSARPVGPIYAERLLAQPAA